MNLVRVNFHTQKDKTKENNKGNKERREVKQG